MSLLSKLLGFMSHEEREGLSLNRAVPWWAVGEVTEFPRFLRQLPPLFSEDALLCLQGTNTQPDVEEFLAQRKGPVISKIALGTIWPRPSVFHMPLNLDNLSRLAAIAEQRVIPEICDHLHVYRGDTVLLEAWDVLDGFISLSGQISEELVKVFCGELGCLYEKCETNRDELSFRKRSRSR